MSKDARFCVFTHGRRAFELALIYNRRVIAENDCSRVIGLDVPLEFLNISSLGSRRQLRVEKATHSLFDKKEIALSMTGGLHGGERWFGGYGWGVLLTFSFGWALQFGMS
jgi:hypothetical protein